MNSSTRIIGLFSALSILPWLCFGADATFRGSPSESLLSGDWDIAENWVENFVPDASNTVEIPSGKTVRVKDNQDQAAKSIDLFGTIEITDRTLTVGSGSTATTSSGGGTIRFKDLTGARESQLLIEDETTIDGVNIRTDAGKVGLITWANSKTDKVKLVATDIRGSVHFFMNADVTLNLEGVRPLFQVDDAADEMLIGPDADPDSGDTSFNNYEMIGKANYINAFGVMRFQRMDLNDVIGIIEAGRTNPSTSVTDVATTEFRHYTDAGKIVASTQITYNVRSYGIFDIKTDLGGLHLAFLDSLNGTNGIPKVKVKAGFMALFDPS